MDAPMARRTVAELVHLGEARQNPIVRGGMTIGVSEPGRCREELDEVSGLCFANHASPLASHSCNNACRFATALPAILFSTFAFGGSPHISSNIVFRPSRNFTFSSHSPRRLTWKCGGSWSSDQNQQYRPRISKHFTFAIVCSPLWSILGYRTFFNL